MRQAGLNVRFGTLDESIVGPVTIALSDGQKLVLEPLERSQRRLGLKNFDPCSILLNNDLSGGIPPDAGKSARAVSAAAAARRLGRSPQIDALLLL